MRILPPMRSERVAMRTSIRNIRKDKERQVSEATKVAAIATPILSGEKALANSMVTTSAVRNAEVVDRAMALLM